MRKGQKTPPEVREKQRAAALGKKKSLAHRSAMSRGRKGMKLSSDHRKNIGAGLTRSYESGDKIAWNFREDREQVKRERQAARFLRNSLHRCLVLSKSEKSNQTFELLGYTPLQLLENITSKLQPGMTWENYGRRGWHIDHVKAIAEHVDLDPKIVNSLDNLAPMWATDNLSKGASTRWSGRKIS